MDQPIAFRLHPDVEARLKRYMDQNAAETAYFKRLVREHPDHAVKTIMCRKMLQFDKLTGLATRLKPVVKAWVDQTPGLHEQIMETIKSIPPLTQNLVYVEEAIHAKIRPAVQLTPLPPGMGLSL